MAKYEHYTIIDKIMDHKVVGISIVFISSLTFLYLLFLSMIGLHVAS